MTDQQPTKSGVLGLLAAAQGIRRTDPLEDLLSLEFGVRIDQPGRLQRDFQTARTLDGSGRFPLTYRFYLADAVFVAAVSGETNLVTSLEEALRHPTFPLSLGRRSCPPVGKLSLGMHDGDLRTVLSSHPWQASPQRRRATGRKVHLEALFDAHPGEEPEVMARDFPLSFDPEHRRYGMRGVVRKSVVLDNPDGSDRSGAGEHCPMAIFGDA